MHKLIYARRSVSSTYESQHTNDILTKNGRRVCATGLVGCVLLTAGSLLAGGILLAGCQGPKYAQFGGYAQGGTWSVKANLKGVKERPQEIQKHIDDILYEIDTTLSGYNKASQLSRLNAGEAVKPSPMFREVLGAAQRFYEETDGAVDCAAGALFDIWGFGFRTDSLPSDAQIQAAMARKLDSFASLGMTVEAGISESPADGQCWGGLPLRDKYRGPRKTKVFGGGRPSPPARRGEENAGRPLFNFNAIAQGYSADKVATYLYSIGVKDMLVDIGEIYCDGLNPQGKPWRIGIDRPKDGNNTPGADMQAILESSGGPQGIVTSGNYRKFYIKDGVKYSHTIDPRTGYPVQHNLLSATIIAPTAMEADAYATYCMVIGKEKAQEFILSRPDLEACLISEDIWTSPGFKLQ